MIMTRILLRSLLILSVAALVAGGIFLLTVNGVISLGEAGASHSPVNGEGFARGGALSQPSGDQLRDGGAQTGFSFNELGGVAVQAGKIALITLLVVMVNAAASLLKR